MIIETMGRYAGWIALEGGLAGGSDIILIPEIPFTIDNICNICTTRHNVGKKFTLITVSEGVKIEPGKYVVQKVVEGSTDPIRLGGVGFALANEIEEKISMEVRVTVLGHLQRGGSPTAFDRILATKLGSEAVHQVMKKNFSTMVSVRGENIVPVKLEDAVNKQKLVTLDDPVVKYARSTGVSFGDESL
jgi:6-phosphofructokinase 1